MKGVFYRITLDIPADAKWEPGTVLHVKNNCCLLVDGEEQGPRMNGTMSARVIRDQDGDIIADVNPMVGEIVGALNLSGVLIIGRQS